MTDLQTRVLSTLGSDWSRSHSPWEGLIRLYTADREVFYKLACGDLGSDGNEMTRPLSDLAMQVRSAVRSTYRIEQSSGGEAVIKPRSGASIPVPGVLLDTVKQFLLEIDGKGVSNKPGKDYEGKSISEAEARFKLGTSVVGESSQARAVEAVSKPL